MTIDEIRDRAEELGFQAVGYCAFDRLREEGSILREWLAEGFGASMRYLARNADLTEHPIRLFPWAKGVLVFLFRWDSIQEVETDWGAWTSSYARGSDYHIKVKERLSKLAGSFPELHAVAQVDATPLPERALARIAGLGWIGKNRFLIHPVLGGDVGIGELVVDRSFDHDPAPCQTSQCGGCTACFDACPTGALTRNGVDARRCLAYWTSETRAALPLDIREGMGLRLLGCDSCLEACPYGKLRAPPPLEKKHITFLKFLLSIRTNREFKTFAEATPFFRLGRKALLRNAVVVAGNLRSEVLIPSLEDVLRNDQAEMVREHAVWALERIGRGQNN